MPPLVLTPDEQALALTKGGTDLRFLLAREEVDDGDQALLYHAGVTTVSRLSAFADTIDSLRDTLRDDFGIDASTSLANRLRATKLVVAWQASQTRQEKIAQVEGEQVARNLPKALASTDYTAMRLAWHKRWWDLEDKQTPSRSFMERLMDTVEADEPRAFHLTEVTNKDEEDPDLLQATLDAAGAMRLKRGFTKVPMPASPEGLRKRIQLLGIAYMMAGLRHSNRVWLQGMGPQNWQDYVEYLLGEWVNGLVAKDGEGNTLATPHWTAVLDYELAMRKDACRRIQSSSMSMLKALKEVTRDPVLKERYFTTPIAFAAVPGGRTSKRVGPSEEDKPLKERRTKPKGRGKGKDKGRGLKRDGNSSGSTGCARNTPDGKPICYKYNNKKEGCARKGCSFAHVCGRCFAAHPMFRCSNAADGVQPPDTAGRGEE